MISKQISCSFLSREAIKMDFDQMAGSSSVQQCDGVE